MVKKYLLILVGVVLVSAMACTTIGFCYYMKHGYTKNSTAYTSGYFEGYQQGRYDERGFGE